MGIEYGNEGKMSRDAGCRVCRIEDGNIKVYAVVYLKKLFASLSFLFSFTLAFWFKEQR